MMLHVSLYYFQLCFQEKQRHRYSMVIWGINNTSTLNFLISFTKTVNWSFFCYKNTIFSKPSAIASILSLSLNLNSSIPFIMVGPVAVAAKIDKIGYSSIILADLSSGTSTPTDLESNKHVNQQLILLLHIFILNFYISSHFY